MDPPTINDTTGKEAPCLAGEHPLWKFKLHLKPGKIVLEPFSPDAGSHHNGTHNLCKPEAPRFILYSSQVFKYGLTWAKSMASPSTPCQTNSLYLPPACFDCARSLSTSASLKWYRYVVVLLVEPSSSWHQHPLAVTCVNITIVIKYGGKGRKLLSARWPMQK